MISYDDSHIFDQKRVVNVVKILNVSRSLLGGAGSGGHCLKYIPPKINMAKLFAMTMILRNVDLHKFNRYFM